jgi:hypothetical protein
LSQRHKFIKIKRINMQVKLTTKSTYEPQRSVHDLILRAIWAIAALVTLSAAIQKPQRIAMRKRLETLIPTVF